ncbi:hydrogenase expression/formation protein HypE [Catalinimonas alkaloidigena]|uniref:AIR synthase-related protein n=1 Tax=Catalinimonas alkaloidigena TaxID=1075417 RepID=UPI002406B003|nr:AIR synthase-related protein [Catalinimonas alkaloidigena]MDF9794894.1 hydrogenase expression/formation protein HypE [Catalinimonas alkaloidigena]
MSAFEDHSGKINSASFKEILLPQSGYARKEVLVGPKYGVDTSVIDLGNGLGMAVSSDPLSLIPSLGLKASAWLSVHLLANDMATTGLPPMYAQFVLNLPTSLSQQAFQEYWKHIHAFCEQIGVNITGGHTGQIEGQNSTISGGGTMFLTAPLDKIISSHQAEPGDVIVVTKETALTSSAILAMSFPETVINKLGKEVYEAACENFYRTSSLSDALVAVEVLQPNIELKAMHDVTEGGVVGAICEMAAASDCGFELHNEELPVGEAPYRITQLFEIDHRYCVGAGAMIMAVKKGKEQALVDHLASKSIRASIVGEMTASQQGFKMIENDEAQSIAFDGNDPYWGAFFKALKNGLR